MKRHDEQHSEGGLATLEAARRLKLEKLNDLGIDPWGARFDDRASIQAIRSRAAEVFYVAADGSQRPLPAVIEPGEDHFRTWLAEQGEGQLRGPRVRAAGRIVLLRDTGKLKFIDIRDQSGQIQLFIGKNQVGPDAWALAECCDLADFLGVEGELRRTKTGELTIFAEQLYFLGKSLEPPPSKHHGLTDPELRHRQRYLDLTYNDGVMDRFLARTTIVTTIRRVLEARGFQEIEGPTLHPIAGGAAARPFTTHHFTLDLKLYLRIALELHLKRLLVGGFERVYELGRVYRNEGISPRHNPEFTMLEVYEAYGNYETMMELTESLLLAAVDALGGGRMLAWGDAELSFEPPFARATYHSLFQQFTGIDPHDTAAVRSLAKSLDIPTEGRHDDVVMNDVFEQKVEKELVGPIFVLDYPASICPLTKRKRSAPLLAERFELFIHGMEIANAYTELNDPDLQEELFRTQLAGLAEDDSMARMDQDFVRALRHGMPPAGGLGIGIDRLVMLLTNTPSIRDVILFPLLRPEA